MMNTAHKLMTFMMTLGFLVTVSPAFAQGQAQQGAAPQQASPEAVNFATQIANSCLNDWTAQQCLSTVSESNAALTQGYMDKLEGAGENDQAMTVKETCAASTAAQSEEIPANAMRSAFTECANSIYDVSEASGVQPDASHYQLLIGAVLCLTEDPRCEMLTQQLSQLKG